MNYGIALLSLVVPQLLWAGLLFHKSSNRLLSSSMDVPKSLVPIVQFWEDIFTKYEANQCVYHDAKHPQVVFLVSRVPLNDKRMMKRQIKKQKDQIRRDLRHLASGKKPHTWLQKRIVSAVPRSLAKGLYYRKAQSRVRCQRGVATDFRQSLSRSELYLPMIKRRFASLGLPNDLAYLPHLESGFNPKAHSKVGARGLWQLMPGTARQFIKVSRRRDDRLNPYLSTSVAARILKDNYRKTQSWPLAITAYNYGINGVVRAIKKYNSSDYMLIRQRHRTRIFGFAAKNFYPSFLAVRNAAKRYEQRKRDSKRLQKAIARGRRAKGRELKQ
ncbi:lytic transglycosylase domain-containing protein [Pseudobacteriovorax antillogorgiicola]|uniref:Transglycosylase SLT domain-containing protein n=1 Tax=Pseudobacteriovorax antillogorgiicola TaxID=1513793 RepID=A0A1Y6CUR0_9BACT|nr:lytic transglycosylase domain-containing protein [Pseudobacteriovorax antillogorgiicola]TCS44376.1 transglycosylase-like protein with SLT domain [Pseudobacteriovorax antillogorgiicola]SMF79431.1 Transglycosylase SLT domain-containing protein [Pseudobacteriovorax antillogorgiicola]